MKRLTVFVALTLIFSLPTIANHISSEAAQKVAKTFLQNNGAKVERLTDLSKTLNFPNLYIFNTDKGFVITSADDCVQPILGYSLTQKILTENMPSNVKNWLQYYNDEIQYAIDNQLRATDEASQLWSDLVNGKPNAAKATIIVDALIKTKWGQNNGYNSLCPYDFNAGELTVTGCAATSMAQILRYWEYPSHGVGSHSYTPHTHPEYGIQSVNYASTTYNWAEMPLNCSNAEIAKLMYHCGVSVNMNYNISANGGSSAYSYDIPSALINYFHYKSSASLKQKSSYSNSNWINLLKAELNASRPIEYNGYGSEGGHAFICDGYDNLNYFHFNWGWYGNFDGFYTLTSLTPGNNHNYTNNQSAIIGIEPRACIVSSPTNLNISTEYIDAFLSWDAVNGAISYYIYRNDTLLAITTDNTYSDYNLEFGTYSYYVKSKDTFGSLSSPSASVSIAIVPTLFNLNVAKDNSNAILNWVEPEGNGLQGNEEVLTYGDGSYANDFGFGNGTNAYFGHRYPASMLSNNMVLNKVSFYASVAGAFNLLVYSSNSGNNRPQTLLSTYSTIVSSVGWNDIIIDDPLQIDHNKDLWVFIYDPEGKSRPIGVGRFNGNNGNYISFSPNNPISYVCPYTGIAILIRTFLNDNQLTYNLYDNNTLIAENIAGTNYSVSNIAPNTAHKYTLIANINNRETYASNMAGLTIGNASLSSLNLRYNDRMTITEGSKLIVYGTLSDVNADNLILENGAQLINNSPGVQATVKKNITPYTENGGWNLIASPMIENQTSSDITGLFANDYDLYIFNHNEELEWLNYKVQSFSIDNKTGFLYANSGTSVLSFTGSLVANTTDTELSYNDNAYFKGLNLIGNPYPCNAYIDRNFYVLNADGSDFILGCNPIPPCSAILVQAEGFGESITFNKTESKNKPHITISVAKTDMTDSTFLDRTKISFNENDCLIKYSLSEQNVKLYIPQNGKEFAVVFAAGQTELPVNFKAAQNGSYILYFENEDLNLDYLHLIDNITGEDVDLLATPKYTFEAKTTDSVERFKIAFE